VTFVGAGALTPFTRVGKRAGSSTSVRVRFRPRTRTRLTFARDDDVFWDERFIARAGRLPEAPLSDDGVQSQRMMDQAMRRRRGGNRRRRTWREDEAEKEGEDGQALT